MAVCAGYLDLNNVTTYLDEYGRPQPDVNRWPSSTGLRGFTRLIDYIHSQGMLFGLHVMRGISEVAVRYQLPVMGTNYTAADVYDPDRVCPWSCVDVSRFYALKEQHPASQAFYDSLYRQYAAWGVDLIKADCYYGDYYLLDQIQAVSDAIDHSGRPMLLSLSAGNGPNPTQRQQAASITNITTVYRMTADTWAYWRRWSIQNHWAAAHNIVDLLGGAQRGRYGLPAYPDFDNPPMGYLTDPYQGRVPYFMSPLTRDEQYTIAAFWMFARAPMFYEGDLVSRTHTRTPPPLHHSLHTGTDHSALPCPVCSAGQRTPDPFSLGLVTNARALQMTDYSANISVVQYAEVNSSVWRSQSTIEKGTSYVALFNILDEQTQTLSLDVGSVAHSGSPCSLQEVWNGTITHQVRTLTLTLRPHASGLYRVFNCSSDLPLRRESVTVE